MDGLNFLWAFRNRNDFCWELRVKLMLCTSLVGLLVVAGACHNQALRKSEEPHDQWRVGKDGLFVGKATVTPLGDTGYALTFRTQEGRIIAKTLPTPKGAGLLDGAYQKFTFYSDAGGLRLDVETRLTDTTVRRTLIEDATCETDIDECTPAALPTDGHFPWKRRRISARS